MRRFLYILLGFNLLFICNPITAQTAYYSQTKIVRGGTSTTNTSGGQYITFADNVVYESDRDGYQVNNSKLEFWKSENGIIYYKGRSYWGTGTIFAFNNDKSIMNVFSQDGTKYVYRKSVAPSSQFTCSLIRSQGSNQSANNTFPTRSSSYSHNVESSNSNLESQSKSACTKEVHHKEKCWNCNGTGRVIQYISVTDYNAWDKKWCDECQSYYTPSTAHIHKNCKYCNGSGYIDKVTYETVYQ